MRVLLFLYAALALPVSSAVQAQGDPEVWSLYRSSLVDQAMIVHVATFDAQISSPTYNRENCRLAAQLFMEQPGVSVDYWCERGRAGESS